MSFQIHLFTFFAVFFLGSGIAYSSEKERKDIKSSEAISFRNIPFGSNELLLKKTFPEFECENAESSYRLADRRCISSSSREEEKCEMAFIERRIRKVDELECKINALSLEDKTKPWVFGGAMASVDVSYIKDSLVRVGVVVDVISYDKIFDAFTHKYGKPVQTKMQDVRNKAGVKFINISSTWKSGGVTLVFSKYGNSSDSSLIEYTLDSAAFELKSRSDKLRKDSTNSI